MESNSSYLFLSSDDSKNYHPDNVGHMFTIELPERVKLEGTWEVAICDIHTEDPLSETVYLYSDISEYNYIKNSLKPVLRMIFPSNINHMIFPVRYYVLIRPKTLGRIKVYIRDRAKNIPNSLSERVELTLHLKRLDG